MKNEMRQVLRRVRKQFVHLKTSYLELSEFA